MIDQFAAGFAAGVEAGIAARALAVQRQQAEALDRVRGRRLAVRGDPGLQDRLAERQQLVGVGRRRSAERLIGQGRQRVDARR